MKHHETLKHSSFDATISPLDAETSALDADMSALDAETSAITRSYRRYWRGVSGDCGVSITPQMCNRVTNHGDMSTFSKPANLSGSLEQAQGTDSQTCLKFRVSQDLSLSCVTLG